MSPTIGIQHKQSAYQMLHVLNMNATDIASQSE